MMRSVSKYLAASVLSVAFLFSTGAHAMETADFDKMPKKDQVDYLVFMVEGTMASLQKQGNSADAQKLSDLFSNSQSGQTPAQGDQQFFANLNAARALNSKNVNNPDQLIEMEQVFGITLKNFGINVPIDDLEALSGNFKPSSSNAANGPLVTDAPPAPPAPAPGHQ
jgi:hypothetical protein